MILGPTSKVSVWKILWQIQLVNPGIEQWYIIHKLQPSSRLSVKVNKISSIGIMKSRIKPLIWDFLLNYCFFNEHPDHTERQFDIHIREGGKHHKEKQSCAPSPPCTTGHVQTYIFIDFWIINQIKKMLIVTFSSLFRWWQSIIKHLLEELLIKFSLN